MEDININTQQSALTNASYDGRLEDVKRLMCDVNVKVNAHDEVYYCYYYVAECLCVCVCQLLCIRGVILIN